jgi:hypothetical protein
VVNETEPLRGSESDYSGLWYASFSYTPTDMFMTRETYVLSTNGSSTTLMITISETSHYIKNVQSPIAKEAEVIFRTLLFDFSCLELCAVAFVVCKLVIIPLMQLLSRVTKKRVEQRIVPSVTSRDLDPSVAEQVMS